ncbi:serine protease inhibitor A3B-like [Arvicanthis niloticus]|uniref:serine protease inhibitor A3B-like n=1 Tax=Arvicanthis niloticus TaxID=61156 RepID=UPI001486DE75|nr:serine protease inhibitor A3B-like [Arvicanthis niloticus]
MAFIAALGMLIAGICPAVLCCSDDTLGRHTAVQKGQDTRKQLDSLTLASINTDFAFSLYKELALKNPNKNIVFSPLGITTALNSLSLGAKGNTLQEILEGLKFNLTETPEADIHQGFGHLLQGLSQPGDQVQIIAGNALFVEQHLQILTEFKEKARALYQTEVFTADFQQPRETSKLINDYVKKQTQGKAKDLVSDLDGRTSIVVVNDLLFTGKWKVPFDPDDTFMGKFILDRKRTVKVPMMKFVNLKTPYFRDEKLKCTVVELKYKGSAKAMFILPDQDKMQQVEASLQPATLKKWRKSLRHRVISEFYLPKFFLSQKYNLENILPELGIREVFSTQADLSGITGAKNTTVSQMIHMAVLNMTETGTKAGAATRVEYDFLSAKIKPISLIMIRAFIYVVIDPRNPFISIMGKVINPIEI